MMYLQMSKKSIFFLMDFNVDLQRITAAKLKGKCHDVIGDTC